TVIMSSSAYHRCLLSFPTRRSSDLQDLRVVPCPRCDPPVPEPLAVAPGDNGVRHRGRREKLADSWKSLRSRSEESASASAGSFRSEEHTSELQSHLNLVCRLLLEKK